MNINVNTIHLLCAVCRSRFMFMCVCVCEDSLVVMLLVKNDKK